MQYQNQTMQLQQQYEKCPKHPLNDIVLFCLAGECKEPLCKDCCKLHVHWHNQQGIPAELDTVDSVRQNLLTDVHNLKIKFEEERAILHHFSDGEHSELLKSIQVKVERVKKNLLQAVNEYCLNLEEQVKQKLLQHRASHPGEKKDLHQKLNSIVQDLDMQEKGLLQQKYIKSCLMVITEERSHDLDGMSTQIDQALKHYLANMFDIFIHEDKLQKIISTMHEYVEIHQANLAEELEIYTKKLREGKKVYGVEPNQQMFQQQSTKGIKPQYTLQQPIPANSIYDPPKSANKFASSGINTYGLTSNANTKNYESRIQSNNEKLKQYYA